MKKTDYYTVTVQSTSYSWMNLNNKKSIFYDLMETIMVFLITYPVLAMITYYILKDSIYIYRAYLFLPALLYFLSARNYISKNYLFILSFVPIFLVMFFVLGPLGEKIPGFIYLIIASIFSINKRSKQVKDYYYIQYLIFGNVVLLLEYIASFQLNFSIIKGAVMLHSIFFSLLCMIYIHITRTKKLMEWEKQTSKESMQRIGKASRAFMIYLSLTFATVDFLILKGGTAGFGEGIIMAILRFLKRLQVLKPQAQQSKGSQGSDSDIAKMLQSIDTGEPSAIIKIIVSIIESILWCLVAVGALFATYAILKFIYQSIRSYLLGKKGKYGEEKESLLDFKDITEDIKERFKLLKKGLPLPASLSNNRRVRKLYYKIVMKNKKAETKIQKSYTPRVIEEVVKKDSDRDISTVTDIYEKARYGEYECKDEDVQRVKGLKP